MIAKLSEILIKFMLTRIIISAKHVIDNLTNVKFRIRMGLILVNNILKKYIKGNIIIFLPCNIVSMKDIHLL